MRREFGIFFEHALTLKFWYKGVYFFNISKIIKMLKCSPFYGKIPVILTVLSWHLLFFTIHPIFSSVRVTSAGSENNCQDDYPPGDCRKRPIWWGLAWKMVWGRRGCENILLQRWKILVSRGRNLPDGDAETRECPWFHCCWQQRYFQSNWFQQRKAYVYYQMRINSLFILIMST